MCKVAMLKCRNIKVHKNINKRKLVLSFGLHIWQLFFQHPSFHPVGRTIRKWLWNMLYCKLYISNGVQIPLHKPHNERLRVQQRQISFSFFSRICIMTCHTDDFAQLVSPLRPPRGFDVMSTVRSVGRLSVFLMSWRCQRAEVHNRAASKFTKCMKTVHHS